MNEILPGVFRWSWLSPPHGYLFNGYLLRLPGLSVCVDPVQAGDEVVEQVLSHRPELTILTNRNHVRMANVLLERGGVRIAIHPADATHAKGQGAVIDYLLEAEGTGPGEAAESRLPPGALERRVQPLRVVPVPGKSPGEIALYWPERRLLVVGDALIGNPPGQVSLLRPAVIDDLDRLRKSVAGLLRLDFDTLLCCDGEPLLTGAKGQVAELVKTFP